ncbi:MAG: ABC transporter permease [Candidatus Omnitrophota bacterium]
MNVWVKDIKELVKYRELLMMLAWKEIKIKYKEPILGLLWALLVPLCMSLTFIFVFTKIFNTPVKGYSFFIFLITGIFPWNFFALVFGSSVMSILEGGALIKKVYFPREIIPLSIVLANAINFAFALLVVIIFIMSFGISLSKYIFLLPIVFVLEVIFVSGMALFIAGAQVVNRDVKFIVEVGLLLWFYLSPIFYPLGHVLNISKRVFDIYTLNPFAGLVSFYRIALLGNTYLNGVPKEINLPKLIIYSAVCCIAVFFLGYRYFKRRESMYVDMIR